MPTQTFLNLKEEKQQKIISAAKKEFKQNLLPDASINKIIKEAEISRGSFYNYFEDINDLYLYLLKDYKLKVFEILKTKTEKNNLLLKQSFFDTITEIFNTNNLDDKQFIKNVFKNFHFSNPGFFMSKKHQPHKKQALEKLFLITDNELKKQQLEVVFMITMHALVAFIVHDQDKEKVLTNYKTKLNFLNFEGEIK